MKASKEFKIINPLGGIINEKLDSKIGGIAKKFVPLSKLWL
jgi:hypothetical protein